MILPIPCVQFNMWFSLKSLEQTVPRLLQNENIIIQHTFARHYGSQHIKCIRRGTVAARGVVGAQDLLQMTEHPLAFGQECITQILSHRIKKCRNTNVFSFCLLFLWNMLITVVIPGDVEITNEVFPRTETTKTDCNFPIRNMVICSCIMNCHNMCWAPTNSNEVVCYAKHKRALWVEAPSIPIEFTGSILDSNSECCLFTTEKDWNVLHDWFWLVTGFCNQMHFNNSNLLKIESFLLNIRDFRSFAWSYV